MNQIEGNGWWTEDVHSRNVLTMSERQADNLELVARYKQWMVDREMTDDTLHAYGSVLKLWCKWCDDLGIVLLAATHNDMAEFVVRPRLKRGVGGIGAPATRRRDVSVLRSFYTWAHNEDLVHRNLAGNLQRPKLARVEPRAIPDNMWLEVWESELVPLMRVTLGLAYYGGLRRAEMMSLTGDNVNVREHRIERFRRKGGDEHTIPLGRMIDACKRGIPGHRNRHLDLFEDQLADVVATVGPHPLVSPWSQNPSPNLINRKFNEAGFPFTPHQCRHSCATNLVKAGVPIHIVSELLGHGSLQVTMGYVKVASTDLADWLDK